MSSKDRELLKIVALGLGSLVNEVVFVGGVTASLYIENKSAPEITPTEDVDLIMNIVSMLDYEALEKKLSKLKFKRDLSNPGPLCRFTFGDIMVDIMPIDPRILGFSNPWYADGFQTAINFELDGITLRIMALAYFLASKLTAFENRAKLNELWNSKDLEDIVVVLEALNDFASTFASFPGQVRDYIQSMLAKLLKAPALEQSFIACLSDYGSKVATEKARSLIDKIKKITA